MRLLSRLHPQRPSIILAIAVCALSPALGYATTYTVTNTADSGAGSLRQAITSATATAGPHTIKFNITSGAVGGVFVITPATALPTLTVSGGITIDGTSQTTFGGDTNPNGPEISLNGNNVVGGLYLGHNNKLIGLNIRNFLGYGVIINGFTNNVVRGCYIGTDPTGQTAQPNGGAGIDCYGSRNTFGGTNSTDRNVFSGNANDGITLRAGAGSNTIQGNYFGTDATGTKALGNGADGIECLGPNNIIGGSAPGARNVFAGQVAAAGVRLGFATVTGTIVRGNYFGTDITGTNAIPNREGVDVVAGSVNTIIDSNLIYGNLRAGIRIQPNIASGDIPSNNFVTANSIYNNGNPNKSYLGISYSEISTTPVANDACDAGAVTNAWQNFPILTAATTASGGVRIQGTLNSVANRSYRIEFFANDECDPTGYGEGQYYLGTTNVVTSGACTAVIDSTLNQAILGDVNLTATATDIGNNTTSEFGPCLQYFPNPIQCDLSPDTALVITNTLHTVTSTVTSNGYPQSGITVDFKVITGPNAGTTGTDVTDANGEASFQYTSPSTTGTDTISATGTVSSVAIDCESTVQWITGLADLAVAKTGTPNPVTLSSSNITYSIIVTNQGPNTPHSVTLTDTLPASLTFVSATPSQGICSNNAGTITCNLGTVANGQIATVEVIGTPTAVGNVTNTAVVSSEHVDLQTANNTAKTVTSVQAAGTDLTVEFTAAFGACVSGTRGLLCPVDAQLILRNSKVVYGDASVTMTNTCTTNSIPARCKLKGILTVNELDLTGLPPHNIAFYLSADTVFDSSDSLMVSLKLTKFLSSLVRGKPIRLSLRLPRGVDLTGQHIIVVVDPLDKTGLDDVAETNENNNTAASPPIPALP